MGYAPSRRAMVEEPRVCQRGVRLVAAALLGLAWVGTAPPAAAQPSDVPTTYGGDIWSRPRLTGDWFGYRDEMGKNGVGSMSTSCRSCRETGPVDATPEWPTAASPSTRSTG